MEESRVHCIIHQTDCLSGEKNVLYQGEASYKKGFLTYLDQSVKQYFIYDDTSMRIKREAEAISIVELHKNEKKSAKVESEYGTLNFETEVLKYQVSEESWEVEYVVRMEDTISIHTKIECNIIKNEKGC